MLKIDDIIKDTRLPSPLRTGETLEQNRNLEIQKIFPLIGLKNCREETPLKIHSEVLPFARHLLNGMYANFVYAIRDATYTCMDFRHQHRYAEADGIDRQILLMKKVRDFLVRAENQDRCISPNSTGTITLNLPITISLQQEERGEHGEEAIFKAGEGLIKVYGKIRSELLKNSCYVLGDIAQTTFFKNFSSANVPGGSYQTVFSSDGEEGAWDLATMSMRGINSCQSWTNSNSRSLTGSIIDPFTGIIYMTNGKKFEGRGDKMLRRCLVRFMINGPKKEPFLSLERMYPDYSPEIAKTFTDFLQKRTKIPVIDFSNRNYDTKPAGCYIPKSSLTNKIKVAKSYVDSGVTYRSYGSSPAVRKKPVVSLLSLKNELYHSLFAALHKRLESSRYLEHRWANISLRTRAIISLIFIRNIHLTGGTALQKKSAALKEAIKNVNFYAAKFGDYVRISYPEYKIKPLVTLFKPVFVKVLKAQDAKLQKLISKQKRLKKPMKKAEPKPLDKTQQLIKHLL